jgi:hypothetical protein
MTVVNQLAHYQHFCIQLSPTGTSSASATKGDVTKPQWTGVTKPAASAGRR